MSSDKHISSNQFVDYETKRTEKGKLRILHQQKVPNPFLIPWYQRAKACLRRSLRMGGDLSPILEGIDILTKKVPENNRQLNDKKASLDALNMYCDMKLPNFIYETNFEVIKISQKNFNLRGINVSLSPELIFKVTKSNGDKAVGAIKIHICKDKPFSFQSAELSSALLHNFLKDAFGKAEQIDPAYCFTIDIFGNRIVHAPLNLNEYNRKINLICDEIIQFWDAA